MPGAATERTDTPRAASDVERDRSGVSLYPGRDAIELCPAAAVGAEPP